MFQVMAREGAITIGADRIELVAKLPGHERGDHWESGQPPFIDHSVT